MPIAPTSKAVVAVDTDIVNSELMYDQLDRLMGASIGVIAIRTREPERAKLLLHQWASMRDMDFGVWTTLTGWGSYKKIPVTEKDEDASRPAIADIEDMGQYLRPVKKEDDTIQFIPAWEKFEKRASDKSNTRNAFCGVFIGIGNDHLIEMAVQQHIRDHVQRAYECDDRAIMLLTPGTTIPDAIVGDVELIDMATPSFAELLDAFQGMEDQIPANFNYTATDADRMLIVQNGLGMTDQEFTNAISLGIVDLSNKQKACEVAKKPFKVIAKDFVKIVRDRKLEILKQTKILELMPDAAMSDVGGLDELKGWLELRKVGFSPEAKAFGIQSPKGFVVVGPPGAGKSLICKAVCNMLGLPGIKFDIGAIFNSLVGSSEARARMALRMVEEMAPCVLFMDEIDKQIGSGSGNDGGTTQRVFGTLLTWMQDRQDKGIPVFIVAAANDVTKIPPEFLRKGRFDQIWAVSFPSLTERETIFKIHVEKRGHSLPAIEYKNLARLTDTFVGSEIESVVEDALFLDFANKAKGITVASVSKCVDDTIPQAKAFPEKIAAMKAWCEQNARMASNTSSFAVGENTPSGLSVGPRRVKRPLKRPLKGASN